MHVLLHRTDNILAISVHVPKTWSYRPDILSPTFTFIPPLEYKTSHHDSTILKNVGISSNMSAHGISNSRFTGSPITSNTSTDIEIVCANGSKHFKSKRDSQFKDPRTFETLQ